MTLDELPEGRLQARCVRCFRQSPVIALPIEEALITLANLGWRHDDAQLLCPICTSRKPRPAR